MQQWSIRIFVENEIKNSKKQLWVLMTELFLIICLDALFTIGFIIQGDWNYAYSIVTFVFIVIILLGLYSWYDTLNYLNKGKAFKKYIDEVYKRKQDGN